jgi:hypothetical protein
MMSGIQRIVDQAQNADTYIRWGLVLARVNNNERALQQLGSALQLLSGEEALHKIQELFEALPGQYRNQARNQIEKRLERLNQSTLCRGH